MPSPIYRGQGNEPYRTRESGPTYRGQTVPYDLNGSPQGGATAAINVTFTPAGNIAATNVQAAIQELDTEKQATGAIVTLPSHTVGALPAVTPAARLIYVSNESGGAVIAFSDGTNWRRVTDRAVVS